MAEKYFATIISIEQNKRQWTFNNNQFYDHHITVKFDNGNQETGIYSSKNPVCTAFQQGVRTEIEREVKVQGQYTNIKYKPVTVAGAKGNFKPGSYGKNKAQEIREHLTLLTANSVKVAFDTVAAEGVPQGMSLEDAIVNKTHSIVMKLAKISGVDKLIEEAKSEKQSSEQQQQQPQAQVQQPIANPSANPAAMVGGPGSPVNMSAQAPIGNAGGMPSDDLPF